MGKDRWWSVAFLVKMLLQFTTVFWKSGQTVLLQADMCHCSQKLFFFLRSGVCWKLKPSGRTEFCGLLGRPQVKNLNQQDKPQMTTKTSTFTPSPSLFSSCSPPSQSSCPVLYILSTELYLVIKEHVNCFRERFLARFWHEFTECVFLFLARRLNRVRFPSAPVPSCMKFYLDVITPTTL